MLVDVYWEDGTSLNMEVGDGLSRDAFKEAVHREIASSGASTTDLRKVVVWDEDGEEWLEVKWWWLLDSSTRPP